MTTTANTFYEYSIAILGNFSGGTAPAGAVAPHPVYTDAEGNEIIQANAITIGGINGLNN